MIRDLNNIRDSVLDIVSYSLVLTKSKVYAPDESLDSPCIPVGVIILPYDEAAAYISPT